MNETIAYSNHDPRDTYAYKLGREEGIKEAIEIVKSFKKETEELEMMDEYSCAPIISRLQSLITNKE